MAIDFEVAVPFGAALALPGRCEGAAWDGGWCGIGCDEKGYEVGPDAVRPGSPRKYAVPERAARSMSKGPATGLSRQVLPPSSETICQ